MWVKCYWCDYWVEDPYIIDWIGRPLCDLCFDWHMGWGQFQCLADTNAEPWRGGPYEPCATTRTVYLLQRLRPPEKPDLAFSLEICYMITSFLCEWHEP